MIVYLFIQLSTLAHNGNKDNVTFVPNQFITPAASVIEFCSA